MKKKLAGPLLLLITLAVPAVARPDCGGEKFICPSGAIDLGVASLSNPRLAFYSHQTEGGLVGLSASMVNIGPRVRLGGLGLGLVGDTQNADYYYQDYQESRAGLILYTPAHVSVVCFDRMCDNTLDLNVLHYWALTGERGQGGRRFQGWAFGLSLGGHIRSH